MNEILYKTKITNRDLITNGFYTEFFKYRGVTYYLEIITQKMSFDRWTHHFTIVRNDKEIVFCRKAKKDDVFEYITLKGYVSFLDEIMYELHKEIDDKLIKEVEKLIKEAEKWA